MKSKSVCFSGHRKIPAESYNIIYTKILGTVKYLAENGYTEFYAGGAVGFDMMAELAVLDVKKTHPNVHLHLIIPYFGHTKSWSDSDKLTFEEILNDADSIKYLYQNYVKWAFSERNRKMVDSSSVLVYFITEEKGGTWDTLKYAAVNDLKLIEIVK